MKIKIDVLQNSKDYLNQSLELAEIADEFGNHNEERANIKIGRASCRERV